jgi:glutamate-ammonia-ligase adenylyltransferase
VAGDRQLTDQLVQIRRDVLSQTRDLSKLKSDVSEMRSKMREQLNKGSDTLFDLKQGEGGITDIEFLVQYAVLAWSQDLPELLVYNDNIRILDALVATNKLSELEGAMLAGAYRFYRRLANRQVLQEKPAVVPIQDVAAYRTQVAAIWQRWMN